MSADKRVISRNSTDLIKLHNVLSLPKRIFFITNLIVGQNNKRTSARRLNNYRNELWIHCREWRVPAALGNANIIVTLLTF